MSEATAGERECNCGYGGFHEPLNPLCQRNLHPVEAAAASEHAWRAVGPNAAELWNRCVNCRADEKSVEGRLPCRNALRQYLEES